MNSLISLPNDVVQYFLNMNNNDIKIISLLRRTHPRFINLTSNITKLTSPIKDIFIPTSYLSNFPNIKEVSSDIIIDVKTVKDIEIINKLENLTIATFNVKYHDERGWFKSKPVGYNNFVQFIIDIMKKHKFPTLFNFINTDYITQITIDQNNLIFIPKKLLFVKPIPHLLELLREIVALRSKNFDLIFTDCEALLKVETKKSIIIEIGELLIFNPIDQELIESIDWEYNGAKMIEQLNCYDNFINSKDKLFNSELIMKILCAYKEVEAHLHPRTVIPPATVKWFKESKYVDVANYSINGKVLNVFGKRNTNIFKRVYLAFKDNNPQFPSLSSHKRVIPIDHFKQLYTDLDLINNTVALIMNKPVPEDNENLSKIKRLLNLKMT